MEDITRFSSGFRKNKIKKSELNKLSGLIRSANEDERVDRGEMEEILEYVESIL